MIEKYLEEQKIPVTILNNSLKNNKLVHAYLFDTNGYSKSNEFILSFVKSILCPNILNKDHDENSCNICTMINDNCYPELKIINPIGMNIKKEQLDELQQEFSNKAIIGSKKIYIINQVEKMNVSSANSILKFLEEPVENIIAILVTDNIYQLLDTIISRCQIISLNKDKKLENDEIRNIMNLLNVENKENFINNEENYKKIDCVKQFIKYYEENKLNVLLYTNKYWFDFFTDKESNLFAYNLMILFYRDILNIKLNKKLNCFVSDYDIISSIARNIELNDICYKIDTLIKYRDKIKCNLNLNLLLDNLIIELERS